MKQRRAKKDQTERPITRLRGASWFDKLVFSCLVIFVLGAVIYAFNENGAPSFREVIGLAIGFVVLMPVLFLFRSGMMIGIYLGNFLLSTAEQKSAKKAYWIGLAKREGLWYAGAVSSLFLVYRWTPFAGHVDIFFILAVAVPLSTIFIFTLYSYWHR